jgi:hypothetical protein
VRRWVCALGVALAALGCGRGSAARSEAAQRLPKGDAVWLTDPTAIAEPGLDGQLQRLGVSAVFLPAGEATFERGRWGFRDAPEPPPVATRPPVVLVVGAGPEIVSALTSPTGSDLEPAGRALAGPLSRDCAAGGPWGRVIGVHLDFPFAFPAAARYAALAEAIRRELPSGVFVTASLSRTPANSDELKQLDPLLGAVEGLVAFVFGVGDRAGPAAVDALHRPWWAAFDTRAIATRTPAGGGPASAVREEFLDRLVGNPRVDFQNDLTVADPNVTAFTLEARGPISLEGLSLAPGDRVAVRLPTLSEMLYQMGSAMAGRRFALGRLVVFGGAGEPGRVLPVAALEDILLGRPLLPVLEVDVARQGRTALSVAAANRTWHASTVSRLANWVEVDLGSAHPSDVQPGGFDRFEVYDPEGRPVTPGRATRIRLFETFVAPMETISPARIVVRGTLPADCCRYRTSTISASGQEVAGDWSVPSPAPAAQPARVSGEPKAKSK